MPVDVGNDNQSHADNSDGYYKLRGSQHKWNRALYTVTNARPHTLLVQGCTHDMKNPQTHQF